MDALVERPEFLLAKRVREAEHGDDVLVDGELRLRRPPLPSAWATAASRPADTSPRAPAAGASSNHTRRRISPAGPSHNTGNWPGLSAASGHLSPPAPGRELNYRRGWSALTLCLHFESIVGSRWSIVLEDLMTIPPGIPTWRVRPAARASVVFGVHVNQAGRGCQRERSWKATSMSGV